MSDTTLVPFFLLNAFETLELGDGEATCTTVVTPWLDGAGELGIQAAATALADCALSFAAATQTDSGTMPVTLSMRLDFRGPPPRPGTRLTGTAAVRPAQGAQLLVQGSVEGPDGVVASASLRSLLIEWRPPAPAAGGPGAAPLRAEPVEIVRLPDEPWSPPAASVQDVLDLPAARLAGLSAVRVGDGLVELDATPAADFGRSQGMVHGGAIPVLGELACAAAFASALPAGVVPRRLDVATDYLRPMPVGVPLRVRARVVHRSRQVAMTHAELSSPEGKPLARVYETAALDVPG